ncbi:MAG TPA: putative porin [Planctomycetota bacterium]
MVRFRLPLFFAVLALVTLGADGALRAQDSGWDQFLEDLDVFGDVRLRSESQLNRDDQLDRHRLRMRLRLGATYRVDEAVKVGARVVTGDPDDPQSPHVTLGDGFDGAQLSLDRAFVTWLPDPDGDLSVTGGKFGNPLVTNPVYGELVWDADVQPEGLLAGYSTTDAGPFERLSVTAGEFVVLEQGNARDAYTTVGQVAAVLPVADGVTATAATSYYYYTEPVPSGSLAILGDNSGNATVDRNGDKIQDGFRSDFGIWNSILAVGFDAFGTPMTVAGEYILNHRAQPDAQHGYALGLAAGSTRESGDWRVYYQWQVVEQDAVFSPVSQDDFLFGTNHRSHLLGVNHQVSDAVGLHLWTLVSARDMTFPRIPTADSGRNQWNVRFDVNIRF